MYDIHLQHNLHFRFDYGEKFWVIKHKQFTCHCASEKCRYNKSNILGFVREYYRRAGEPVPSDSPASSGRQSPQNLSSAATPSSGSTNGLDSKAETQPKAEGDESVTKDTLNVSDAKEKSEKGTDVPNVAAADIESECKNDSSPKVVEVSVEGEGGSPTIKVKLTKLSKDNDKESELVSEILGGKKPTVILEKELPKTPKSEGKFSLLKGESSINPKKLESGDGGSETPTLTNSGRPKRLVRKVVEDKDKKDKEKDKTK